MVVGYVINVLTFSSVIYLSPARCIAELNPLDAIGRRISIKTSLYKNNTGCDFREIRRLAACIFISVIQFDKSLITESFNLFADNQGI